MTTPEQAPALSVVARAPRVTSRRRLPADVWPLLLSVAYFVVLLPFVPDLANPENIGNILANMLPLLAIALGQTFVLITGGIDLSATSIVALASVGGAYAMTHAGAGVFAVGVGVVAMLALGALVGAANGLAVTRLSMPPFMVTLTSMLFVSGLAIWSTKSKGIYDLPGAFDDFAQGSFGVVPYAFPIFALLAWGAHTVLARSLFGRRLFAVGLNAKTARVSGVPVARTVVLAYVASGLGAALASVLYTGRLETGSPVMGQRVFLDVIGAAVIGGTSLFGGKGTVLGTAFGVLFITLIDNGLNLMGLSNFTVLIAKGTVILAAALVDTLRSRAAAARA